jgi:alginate O-acetyltransferase complex protein AlgI
MVFSSLTFLFFFLPLTLIFHYITKNNLFRNLSLTVFSLIFYAWGEPLWVFLLLFSAIFDYGNGLLIAKYLSKSKLKAKWILALSIIGNVGILIAFKYGGFIYDNINYFITLPFARPTNSLPIGISFYTFQTVSYTIDVYRGEVKAQKNIVNFLMFVSLFHQLVAGPIVRYQTIEAEMENRKFNWADISSGVGRFCFGLFKKVIIANTAGELVTKYLENGFSDLSSPEAWFGITLFSIQIYFDFSGYSDMAIGLGRMFGFHYDENFKHPYAAISVGDFYRRWHISLGKFFRDYVYIPLGGNRKMQLRNIMIVWLLTGLWHGASWNFVLWGFYFGCFMIIEKLLENVLKKTPRIIRHCYTLFLIIFSRSIFYFVDFSKLKQFIAKLFINPLPVKDAFYTDIYSHAFWFILVILLCIPWDEILKPEHYLRKKTELIYAYAQPVVNGLLLILCITFLIDSTYNPFIYFRF